MFRLDQEKEFCSFYLWLTLQYDPEHVPVKDGEMCFSKEHCRGFFEKLRKKYGLEGTTFKHFLVSEYGPNGTKRPHYHCLLLVYNDKSLADNYLFKQELKQFIFDKAWTYGHVTEKGFHGRVLRYLTKYCCKPELIGDYHRMKPFTLISKGIGLDYLKTLPKKQIEQMKESLNFTVYYGSSKIQLPRYYVDKILPHSLEDLRKCETQDQRLELRKTRRALQERNKLAFNQFHVDYERDPYLFIKSKENNRLAKTQEFISKIKSRKDL